MSALKAFEASADKKQKQSRKFSQMQSKIAQYSSSQAASSKPLDLHELFMRENQDNVDLLRFVLASAFASKGYMVGSLKTQDLQLYSQARHAEVLSRTATLTNIVPDGYASKENATLLMKELEVRDADVTTGVLHGQKYVRIVVPERKLHSSVSASSGLTG